MNLTYNYKTNTFIGQQNLKQLPLTMQMILNKSQTAFFVDPESPISFTIHDKQPGSIDAIQ
jgi:hypothetical protein